MWEWLRITFTPFADSGATPTQGLGRVPNLCVRWVVYCAGGLLELKGFNTCSAFDDFVG